MSIQEIVLKIKSWVGDEAWERLENTLKWVIMAISGLGVAIIGFCIGSLVQINKRTVSEPIQVIYPPQPTISCESIGKSPSKNKSSNPQSPKQTKQGDYVGSKNGKTYYTKDCKGINRIKPENRVYFSTVAEAQAQGYSLSKTCSSSRSTTLNLI